jgi:hypothetical protein
VTDRDRRRRHAEFIRGTAVGVLDAMIDPARPDAASDRADLARLMIEIADAWRSVMTDENATLAEQLRWSRVSVSAIQIAERLSAEAEEMKGQPARLGKIRRLFPTER